ncbi:MAG: head-tail adaptor protein [Synergistaceae bacterium]|nr:head-tail adaptor protein [Candidatus Equadaptatus faecalis]
MSLIDNMLTDCVIMNKMKMPDGEGGYIVEWQEGAQIQAAITLDTSMQARIAEKQGVTSTFTVTTSKDLKLEFHDVIKRLSDGKTFRITSDAGDKEAPSVSTLDIAQAKAEKWELTN